MKAPEGFVNDAALLGIEINGPLQDAFSLYADRLLQANSVMNLTRITEERDIYYLHFLDSMAGVPFIRQLINGSGRPLSLTDIGTGAGFPGMVLQMLLPTLSVTLADSVGKKLSFLDGLWTELSDMLDIPSSQCRTLHIRAEDMEKEAADVVCSRAVSELAVLAEYCLPHLRVGGHMLAYKGPDPAVEVKEAERALKILGGTVREVRTFTLPGTDAGRSLIIIEKTKATPRKYPRKAGTPSRDPLK